MQKNDTATLEILRLSADGSGVGFLDGMAVFVPFTAVGDIVAIKLVQVRKTYAFGIVEKMITPSSHRQPPVCPVYGKCGGCSLQHITREQELKAKQGFVADALSRIGGIDTAVNETLFAPDRLGYRNKVQFPAADFGSGIACALYAPRSHRPVRADTCLLQMPVLSDVAEKTFALLREFGVTPYNEKTRRGLLRHLYLRCSSETGKVMACFVLNAQKLPNETEFAQKLAQKCPQLCSIYVNINTADTNVILGSKQRIIYGQRVITDTLAGIELALQPQSFFQVNRDAAQLLYEQIKLFVDPKPTENILDLFCGAGSIGLSLADSCCSVTGVEIIPGAVEDARSNAAKAGFTNCEFILANAQEISSHPALQSRHYHCVITDPPRKGCAKETLEFISQLSPERIVMVSCDPATLARDLAVLKSLGYQTVRVQPVDMFPCTEHVETVVLLTKTLSTTQENK